VNLNQPHDGSAHDTDRTNAAIALALSLVAAAAARKIAAVMWTGATGRTPPSATRDDASSTMVLVLWGAAMGATVGAARVLAERQAVKISHARSGSSDDE
jgi:hypothetical protein